MAHLLACFPEVPAFTGQKPHLPTWHPQSQGKSSDPPPPVLCFTTPLRAPLVSARRRQWHPTPVLLPGKSHRKRSLVGCSPWGRGESDTTEQLHFHFSLSCIGEGKGNPLQCSCLENHRDGGVWRAAVYGVAESRTRLKRLSSSSSSNSVSQSNLPPSSQPFLKSIHTSLQGSRGQFHPDPTPKLTCSHLSPFLLSTTHAGLHATLATSFFPRQFTQWVFRKHPLRARFSSVCWSTVGEEKDWIPVVVELICQWKINK